MRQSRKGPEYSRDREFTVVLEDLHQSFKGFGEGMEDIRHRLGRVENDVSELKTDMTQVKFELGHVKSEMGQMKTEMGLVKTEMEHFRRVLPTLATKDDLLALERRLIRLETSH